MNITLSIDENLVARAREKLRATGKSVNQEIRDHLRRIVGDDDAQLQKDLDFLRATAGLGKPDGAKWSRDDVYEERLRWPR
jgi:hypothetical protein